MVIQSFLMYIVVLLISITSTEPPLKTYEPPCKAFDSVEEESHSTLLCLEDSTHTATFAPAHLGQRSGIYFHLSPNNTGSPSLRYLNLITSCRPPIVTITHPAVIIALLPGIPRRIRRNHHSPMCRRILNLIEFLPASSQTSRGTKKCFKMCLSTTTY